MKYSILSILLILSTSLVAQLDLGFIRDGNDSYNSKNYTNSEESYRRALEINTENYKGMFNLGNSIYQQERYEEAVKHFESASAYAPDDNTRAQALHNLGNSHLKLKDYENSVKAYIESLKLNPSDQDAKYNLAYALQKLKEQQQQQQEQENSDCDNGDQNKDQEQQDKEQEQKDKENKDQEQKDQESQDNKGEEGEEKQEEQQKDQKKADEENEQEDAKDKKIENPEEGTPQDSTLLKKVEMSMEEVLKILEIMDNEEQKVQQKLRAPKGDRRKTDKDW